MNKKVFLISSSRRKNGNSNRLAGEFMRGAKDRGHEATLVNLAEKQIEFCLGCFVCQKTGKCVIKDDAASILESMREADVVVFATPVYFYGMCGALKNFLDRTYPLFPDHYVFRDIYLLAAAGEDLKTTISGTVTGLEGWVRCFEKTRLADVVFAGGVMEKGEIESHPALQKAYKAGNNV